MTNTTTSHFELFSIVYLRSGDPTPLVIKAQARGALGGWTVWCALATQPNGRQEAFDAEALTVTPPFDFSGRLTPTGKRLYCIQGGFA